ncbi:MAG: START domain-containing protein [Pseudomonadales bacterium]|nr:START domain-containing protein [Pseudomonadales bacterium]
MMKSLIGRVVLVLFLFATFQSYLLAAEEEWELKRDRDNIQVYTRSVEGSPYDAVRTITVADDVRLSSFVALIVDAEACPDWADRCAESYVIEQVSDTENYVYTHNDLPFPVKDRDVVSHVIWTQEPNTLIVEMNSQAVAGRHEEVRGRLRLQMAQASWRFEPLGGGQIRIISDAHIDPGSALPSWVTNMLLVDTPFETMKSLVEEVRNPKYRDAQLGFIQDE